MKKRPTFALHNALSALHDSYAEIASYTDRGDYIPCEEGLLLLEKLHTQFQDTANLIALYRQRIAQRMEALAGEEVL